MKMQPAQTITRVRTYPARMVLNGMEVAAVERMVEAALAVCTFDPETRAVGREMARLAEARRNIEAYNRLVEDDDLPF
jgi:hypothetical protein